MATTPRLTMFFVYGEFGWSETHWYLGSNTNLQQVINAATPMVQARCNMLGWGPICEYVRASYDDTWRDSLVGNGIPPSYAVTGQTNVFAYQKYSSLAGAYADNSYSVTLIRMSGGSLYRKSLYLSGVPAGLQQSPFNLATMESSAWFGYFGAWAALMAPTATASVWGFKVRSKETADSPILNITAATVNAGLQAQITVPSSSFLTGSQIRILGTKSAGGRLNGTWYIYSAAPPVYVLYNWKPNPQIPFQYFGGGTAQQIVTKVVPYTQAIIEGLTHRKRGRPFNSPHGKARAGTR